MKKEMTYEEALGKAAALCSGSEHCTRDIETKMRKWGITDDDIGKAIDYLVDEKYIDNSRYARAYCSDKFRYNQWGRIKIQQMLRMQGISDRDIRQGLEVIDEDEYLEMLKDIIRKKDRQLKDEDPYQRKGKLIRHALSHGFEMDLVMDVLDD